jgi:hypothetical protein
VKRKAQQKVYTYWHVRTASNRAAAMTDAGWLKWAEYDYTRFGLQNVFDVSSKFAHRNSGGRANWLGSLFSHEYL